MLSYRRGSFWAGVVFAALIAIGPVAATEAGKLLPAGTDLILTVQVRQFLTDHKNTEVVQEFLNQWRQSVNKDALGFDLTQDIDRITCGFNTGESGFFVGLVEGKFQKDKLRSAIQQFAKLNGVSFQAAKVGDREVWQVPDADGFHFVLLNEKILAITSGKKPLDDLLARSAGEKKDGLSASMQNLLAKSQKEHVSLLVDRLDVCLQEAVKFLQDQIANQGQINDGVAQVVANQITSGIQKYARDLSTASIGLTIGKDELKVQLDLETKNPKLAKELRAKVNEFNFLTVLALKALNHELAHQWADILRKTRVSVADATLTIQLQIPYEFIQQAWQRAWPENVIPGDPKNAQAGLTAWQQINHALLEAAMRRVTSIKIWGLVQPQPPGALAIEEELDLPYCTGPQADFYRHRLDLFYPKGKKNCPVVVLVHGGAWIVGDNRACGLYTSLGQFLASQGIGVVLPNYRLSPWIKHPEHVKDLARAVAWTHAHIAEYGGNPERLFLLGHSAGGHLVSLLGTDESYLKAEGLKTTDIKGVITSSGIYHLPPGNVSVTLGGSGPKSVRLDQMLPVRGQSICSPDILLPGIPSTRDIYSHAFGHDPKDRAKASPLTHVRPGLPPFLILSAENDYPTLPEMAAEFHNALLREKCDTQLIKMKKRNHNSILFSAIHPQDPTAQAILEFIHKK